MSLRRRLIILLLSAASITVAGLFLLSRFVLLNSYLELERAEISRDVNRVREALNKELNFLNKTSADWAYWDETYTFIQDGNLKYVEDNLDLSTPQTLGLDLMVFYNLDGQPVVALSLHPQTGRLQPLADEITTLTRAQFTLLPQDDTQQVRSGLISTPAGPLLASMRYILTSNAEGPPAGVLVFGKYLDLEMIDEWSRLTQVSLDVAAIGQPEPSPDYKYALETLVSDPQGIVTQNFKAGQQGFNLETIAAYTLLTGMDGDDVAVLRVTAPRSIYHQGVSNLRNFAIFIIIASLAGACIIYFYIERTFSRRLMAIIQGFNHFRQTRDFGIRILDEGSDELASLALAVNQTMSEIGSYEDGLLKSERHFREVLQKLHLLAVILDTDGKITFCNDFFLSVAGWYRYEVMNRDWFELFIIPEERQHNRSKYYRALYQGLDQPYSESYLVTRSGEKRLIAWNNAVLRDSSDNLTGMACIGEDITILRQNEQKIRQSLEETRLHLSRLTTLRKIDSAITSTDDMHEKLRVVMKVIKESLGVDAVDILILEPVTRALIPTATDGNDLALIPPLNLLQGEGELNRIFDASEVLIFPELTRETLPDWLALRFRDHCPYSFYAAAPMITGGKHIGILEVFAKRNFTRDNEWDSHLLSLALQAAIAYENAEMLQRIQRANRELAQAYEATLKGWANALELRDKETSGHSERMRDLATRLGERMGLNEMQLSNLSRGVLLHDIGKMGVPDYILHKPGPLTEDQWKVMQKHPQFAYDLLSDVPYLSGALEVPYCHHERWDGSGYPRGLKGKDIPLNARIFAVIDVWDALTHDRPYRSAWSREQTVQYIIDNAGIQFDPQVVEEFIRMLQEESPEVIAAVENPAAA